MNSTHPSFPSIDLAKCGSKPRVTPETGGILESSYDVLGSRTERWEPVITITRHSVYVNIGELQRGTAGCEAGRRVDQRSQAFEPNPGSQESVYELQDPPGSRAQKTESYEHSRHSILEPDYILADSSVLIRHKNFTLKRIKSIFPPKDRPTNRGTTGDGRSRSGQAEHSPTNTYEYFVSAEDSTRINDTNSPVSSSVSNSGRKIQLQTATSVNKNHTPSYINMSALRPIVRTGNGDETAKTNSSQQNGFEGRGQTVNPTKIRKPQMRLQCNIQFIVVVVVTAVTCLSAGIAVGWFGAIADRNSSCQLIASLGHETKTTSDNSSTAPEVYTSSVGSTTPTTKTTTAPTSTTKTTTTKTTPATTKTTPSTTTPTTTTTKTTTTTRPSTTNDPRVNPLYSYGE